MEQTNCTTKRLKYKHLKERDRYRLEGYLESGLSVQEIAVKLNIHRATAYREIKRGSLLRLTTELSEYRVYRANAAQRNYQSMVTNRRRSLKIERDKSLENYIRKKVLKDRCSPDAVIGRVKLKRLKFKTTICTKTLYNYIDRGALSGVSNLSLWEKRKRRKHRYRHLNRIALRNKGSRSIEERPEDINRRLGYGHWEGDCIVGRRNARKDALFTLSERMSREQIIIKVASLTQGSILAAMNKLEAGYGQQFKDKFKSITFDNGGEFLDWKAIERSSLNSQKRTLVYFAHPYSAWERGTNENQNKMIRRFIPKGTDISKISEKELKEIEKWMNNYPRKILGYRSASELVFEVTKNSLDTFN